MRPKTDRLKEALRLIAQLEILARGYHQGRERSINVDDITRRERILAAAREFMAGEGHPEFTFEGGRTPLGARFTAAVYEDEWGAVWAHAFVGVVEPSEMLRRLREDALPFYPWENGGFKSCGNHGHPVRWIQIGKEAQ